MPGNHGNTSHVRVDCSTTSMVKRFLQGVTFARFTIVVKVPANVFYRHMRWSSSLLDKWRKQWPHKQILDWEAKVMKAAVPHLTAADTVRTLKYKNILIFLAIIVVLLVGMKFLADSLGNRMSD